MRGHKSSSKILKTPTASPTTKLPQSNSAPFKKLADSRTANDRTTNSSKPPSVPPKSKKSPSYS